MSVARSDSQSIPFGRRRSNTAQSLFKNTPLSATPLRMGDTKTLTTWVHNPSDSPHVILNRTWWPGLMEGDMLRMSAEPVDAEMGCLFIVPRDEGLLKHQLQISIPRPLAEKFGFRNNGEVFLTKVDPAKCSADYVELAFQDQYLGRNEMWRLGCHLVGQCVYIEQEISFIGVIAAKVHAIYINGKKVSAGYVTSSTKTIYRSLSAKVTLFIQVCRELWEFAGDGERYNEKIVHSFLPELFNHWREAGTNHIVTIVLISRVFYDSSETDYAAGPLRRDDEGRWYKDFFKVITDLQVLYDWKPTLVRLKDSFWAFQRDILLAHHYHQRTAQSTIFSTSSSPPDHVRLVGQLSFAHDGPILEAINLGLNPNEMHYIDRCLSATGSSTIIITPGTGYFRVSKQLLRLTTTRMLDQGFILNLVSLAKPPLHQSPIFSFQGYEPEARPESGKVGSRALDPLWGGGDDAKDEPGKERTTFWWEPFWMSVSFWDKQMDLPFREDRFVARAKMHEIEMLGLLDYDVLTMIEIPFLPDSGAAVISQDDADQFDMDTFALPASHETKGKMNNRSSVASSGSVSTANMQLRPNDTYPYKRTGRISDASRIPPIEESPRRVLRDLPSEGSPDDKKLASGMLSGLSTSPSQSSIRSVRTMRSQVSVVSNLSATANTSTTQSDKASLSRGSTAARFTPSWLFSPFRSGPSQPQTSVVSASTNNSPTTPVTPTPSNVVPAAVSNVHARPREGLTIKNAPVSRSMRGRPIEEEPTHQRSSLIRLSPGTTPPRDEITFGKRRSATMSSMALVPASSSPGIRANPSRLLLSVPYAQSSLARRWQHAFPQPLSKHTIKWKAMCLPGCLPLTVEHFPTATELETSYDVFSYDFVVDPPEMRSFLVNPPTLSAGASADDVRRAWALAVMRGMVAQRLAQGFQFVLRPSTRTAPQATVAPAGLPTPPESHVMAAFRRSKSFVTEDEMAPNLVGAAEALKSPDDPVYLSMSNEIHRIAYGGDAVQVRRYVRRMPRTQPFQYQCLIWPRLGVGYSELSTSFVSQGLENYGWNRLDMLVAGYETQFHESLRYWRTRFVVIPTDDAPSMSVGPSGEKLNDEEIRLLGIDKLAELFTKVRWQPPEERGKPVTPVRFIPTDLGPSACIQDENVVAQLDEIHAQGPLRKKMKSERDIADMSLAAVAKAMREEDGVPIKEHRWHGNRYPNSFTGAQFVSWLVREFRDVSTREQGAEWGAKLQEQGLFDHGRGMHGFLDGHYFYVLRGEYIIPVTPRSGWFRSSRHVSGEDTIVRSGYYPGSGTKIVKKARKRLILSQSMVIDVDPHKRSDQAESVILHHDIIHNPATCFHFEFQWIGTTARCIDDLLRQWSRTIERYGLKLVEAYVTQISDIRDSNPFQSCYPLPLAVPPPIVPDLERRVAEGTPTAHYFEYALLRKFGFVLDIEAAELYPEQVDVVYSYRRSAFRYSQWVHKSGVAFVQVLGGSRGFLFLTNRLMAPGRIGTALKYQRPAAAAEEIRKSLDAFCSDSGKLTRFYDEELAQLDHVLDEPPPLHI